MEDETERTLYCGNLDNRVTEDILYELFVQVRNVNLHLFPVQIQDLDASAWVQQLQRKAKVLRLHGFDWFYSMRVLRGREWEERP